MIEGRVIQGRYRLLSKLGQGGMGAVWRGEHIELRTPVAIKVLSSAVLDSKVALARFKREAQSAASLRGANVVQILDYGIDDGSPYIVMELLEGESLAARLSRKAPLTPPETSFILGQVGKAVERAHGMQIVHRDLKPDNIFIVRDGDEEVTKVLDFGIAKTLSNETFEASIQTKSGAILGTPHYMSPEQAAGRTGVDHRSDVWSLGVIAFECLTGYRPFNGATLGGLVVAICTDPIPLPTSVGSVPRGFDNWFVRCVARDPTQRFQSMMDAVRSLRSVCEVSSAYGAIVPMADSEVRETTLQASSREPTLLASSRKPGSSTPNAQAANASAELANGESGAETVSGSSRTLGATRRRRSVAVYVALGLTLLVGGGMGAIRLRAALSYSSIAPSAAAAASLEAVPSGSRSTAQVASINTPSEPSASAPSIQVVEVEQVAVSARSGPTERHQIAEKSASAKALTNRPKPAASGTAAPPKVDDVTPPVVPAEPANRPDPMPAESSGPSRRRNVEDRLAF